MSEMNREGLDESLALASWMNQSLPMRFLGDPILREVCEPVASYEFGTKHVANITAELVSTLKQYRERTGIGRGLAANQIGYSKRIIAVWWDIQPEVMFNPEVHTTSGMGSYWESCLSGGGMLLGEVHRAWKGTFDYQDKNGRFKCLEADELQTRVMLHEIDHLDGITCDQKYVPGTLTLVTGGKEEILSHPPRQLE